MTNQNLPSFSGRFKNETGKRHGRLVALCWVGSNQHREALWSCQCDCGKRKIISGASLRSGATKSCGCLSVEVLRKRLLFNNPTRKGGRIESGGYILLRKPGEGKYRAEHVLKAERVLDRKLKHRKEVVHHINGIRNDNRNCNLLICSSSYHAWLHQRMAQRFQELFLGGKK